MAGARPSTFRKGGGGFLDGVDGVIVNYQFTDEFNGEPFVPGKSAAGKERFHSLYARLSVRVDGAEEDTTTTLFAGGADDFDISDDGYTLTSDEDKSLSGTTAWGKFIQSLVEAGFDENTLPEDSVNFQAIIGTRARFVQRVDAETTKKLGKKIDKKTGRAYDRKDLVVDNVYSVATPAKASKPAAKTAKGNAVKPAAVDLTDLAVETLQSIVSKAGGKIAKSKLSMQVLKALVGRPECEAVRKLINTDDFLSGVEGVEFDGTTVSVSE